MKYHSVETGYEVGSIKSQDPHLCPVHQWEGGKPVLHEFWFCHCRPKLLHPQVLLNFPLPNKNSNRKISFMFRAAHATVCKRIKGFFKFHSNAQHSCHICSAQSCKTEFKLIDLSRSVPILRNMESENSSVLFGCLLCEKWAQASTTPVSRSHMSA